MIAASSANRGRRRGFTLVEMTVVCFMLSLLASLMAGAWAAFGRPAGDVDARCRIAQEASLAAETLCRDLSGYLPGSDARLGGSASSKLVGRMEPENTSLNLCFDSQSSPNGAADWASPDTVVVYFLASGILNRWDQSANVVTPVARYVTNFQAVDQGGSVSIEITFSYRNFQRTYNLIGVDP
jgi:prepilin-type N-terminal cleavage/methylation domain-containing protein